MARRQRPELTGPGLCSELRLTLAGQHSRSLSLSRCALKLDAFRTGCPDRPAAAPKLTAEQTELCHCSLKFSTFASSSRRRRRRQRKPFGTHQQACLGRWACPPEQPALCGRRRRHLCASAALKSSPTAGRSIGDSMYRALTAESSRSAHTYIRTAHIGWARVRTVGSPGAASRLI
jgi:hypothetical protein